MQLSRLVRISAAALAFAGGLSVAHAQDEADAPTPQSVAIELFGLANDAIGAEDYETARRTLEAALALKPAHPAVLRGLVITGMRAGRPADAFSALERIAAAGLTYDMASVEALREADADRFDAVSALIDANGAPVGRAEIVARLDTGGELIEGVAMDIETDRLYVSSVSGRRIYLLEPFSRDEPEVFADQEDGLWSVFGLAVDDRNRMLWAATGTVPQTPLGDGEADGTALMAFDLVTGDHYASWTIDGAVQMADFVVRDGVVYISDSQAPRIYRLDSLQGELELLAEDPRMVSLQGVALSHGALYAADYATGIWRIDLSDGTATLVRSPDASLIGIDGFRQTRSGRLIAVRNGAVPRQVMALDLSEDGLTIETVEVLLRGHEAMMADTEPTLIDLADGRAWLVANAAWPRFPQDGSAPEQEIPPAIILEMDME